MKTGQVKDWIGRYVAVCRAELRRVWLTETKYPLQMLGNVIVLYLLFRAITWGSGMLGPLMGLETFREGQTERLVGFVLFVLLSSVMQQGAALIQHESVMGVFEQVYLSPVGLPVVILIRGLVSLVIGLAPMGLLILAGSLTMPLVVRQVSWTTVVVIVVGTVGMQGVGLMLAGLSLLYKRTQTLTNLLTFAMLALSAVPAGHAQGIGGILAGAFPFTQTVHLVSTTLLGQAIAPAAWWRLCGGCLGFFALGAVLLNRAEHVAKDRGLIGQY